MQRATIRLVVIALGLLTTCFRSTVSRAQANPTATRGAGIDIFALGSEINTNYGNRQSGATLGADYSRFFPRLRITPSLEFRAILSPVGPPRSKDV